MTQRSRRGSANSSGRKKKASTVSNPVEESESDENMLTIFNAIKKGIQEKTMKHESKLQKELRKFCLIWNEKSIELRFRQKNEISKRIEVHEQLLSSLQARNDEANAKLQEQIILCQDLLRNDIIHLSQLLEPLKTELKGDWFQKEEKRVKRRRVI